MNVPPIHDVKLYPVILDMDFRILVGYKRNVGIPLPHKAVAQPAKVICLRRGVLPDFDIDNNTGLVESPVINPIVLFSDEAFYAAL